MHCRTYRCHLILLLPSLLCHCHPIISCFIRFQNDLTFLVQAYLVGLAEYQQAGYSASIIKTLAHKHAYGNQEINILLLFSPVFSLRLVLSCHSTNIVEANTAILIAVCGLASSVFFFHLFRKRTSSG